MLTATELANQYTESKPLTPELETQVFGHKCPQCGCKNITFLKDIGEWLDCDLRNPDDEVFRCNRCEWTVHLMKEPLKILGCADRQYYGLVSDGTFLYIRKGKETWKI